MDRNRDIGQQKVVDLDRGLFCVQYQSADDETSPPKVVISPAPGDEPKVDFILHPDADQAVLWQPGSSLVVRTSSSAQLSVQVLPLRPNGSKAAFVKFENLTQGTPQASLTTTIEISKLTAFDYLGMLRAWAMLSLVLTNGLRDLKPPRELKALRSNGRRSLTIWNCGMPSNPRARRSLQKWSISKHLPGRGDEPYPSPALC